MKDSKNSSLSLLPDGCYKFNGYVDTLTKMADFPTECHGTYGLIVSKIGIDWPVFQFILSMNGNIYFRIGNTWYKGQAPKYGAWKKLVFQS